VVRPFDPRETDAGRESPDAVHRFVAAVDVVGAALASAQACGMPHTPKPEQEASPERGRALLATSRDSAPGETGEAGGIARAE
jgi:hypothetical protein